MFSDVKANEQSGKPSIPFLLFSCLFLSLPYSTQHHCNQPCNEHTDKDKKVFLKKKKKKKRQQVEIEKHERGFNPIQREKEKEHRLSAWGSN